MSEATTLPTEPLPLPTFGVTIAAGNFDFTRKGFKNVAALIDGAQGIIFCYRQVHFKIGAQTEQICNRFEWNHMHSFTSVDSTTSSVDLISLICGT